MSKYTRGTPKTIEEALQNAFNDSYGKTEAEAIVIFKYTLKDFLAQKFMVIDTDELADTWARIFPGKAS